MDEAFFVQLALSGGAVAVLVAIAAWARIAKPAGPLDEHKARGILEYEFPGRTLDAIWVASNGAGALAKSGGMALVICQVGDGFAARQIPWAQAISASFKNGKLCVDLTDISAPRATLSLPSWPPTNLAA
ncbi:MAG: hypothetical protein KKE02_05565 [Alphaproteobacteria bacterium]|nr:hypothetical protein [Alphaproteobacteria bacterium]MBU1513903.1 hypothetical protein [Alphaproteobacteria bacterium]MBU2094169.1 hypothetical protein [Alphaproteobacteria bacterium]MBU2150467.1 hypothetical protein [Alphaproteobacteria bacterium]MBU2307659.1 hypothetical protein [Alphaproteobacteria bacterium]